MVTRKHIFLLSIVSLFALITTGCDFVDDKVLAGSREYFPKAEVYKLHPQMIHIETHVGNVSGAFAKKTFDAMLATPQGEQLKTFLPLAGYRWFVLGFDDFNVVWDLQAKRYDVFGPGQYKNWFTRTIGRRPENFQVVGRPDVGKTGESNILNDPSHVPGSEITAPVVLFQPLPIYTDAAREARIEGIVLIQVIIRKDGTVDSFKVIKGLGYGLDESAIKTIATNWRFKPGTRNGDPVDVQANIEVSFRLGNYLKDN
jgi:TonB family protein